MPRWLRKVLPRIREQARGGRVRFTYKALQELASLELGLDQDDCCDILASLTAADSAGRVRSPFTDEWMYVFKPRVGGVRAYVKVILRSDCVVVSFHEEVTTDDDQD
jgi:hypothetical protein